MAERKWNKWHSQPNALVVDWEAVRGVFKSIQTDDVPGTTILSQLESDYKVWIENRQLQGIETVALDYKAIHHRLVLPPRRSYPDWTWLRALYDILKGETESVNHFVDSIQDTILSGPDTTVLSNWSILFSSLPNEILAKFNTMRNAFVEKPQGDTEEEYLWWLKHDALNVIEYFCTPEGARLLSHKLPIIKTVLKQKTKIVEVFAKTPYAYMVRDLRANSKNWNLIKEFLTETVTWIKTQKRPLSLYGVNADYGNRASICMEYACLDWFKANKQRPLIPKVPFNWNAYVNLLCRASNAVMYGSNNRLVNNFIDPFMQVALLNSSISKDFEKHLKLHSPINTLLVMSTETV